MLEQTKNGKKFDEKLFQQFLGLMENQQFDKRQFVADHVRVRTFEHQKNWGAYTLAINSLLTEDRYKDVSSGILDKWFKPILESDCKDVEVLQNAISWTELAFKNDNTFSIGRLSKYLETKIKFLERIPNSTTKLQQAETELALLAELEIKQQKFATDKAKTMKMIEALAEKK